MLKLPCPNPPETEPCSRDFPEASVEDLERAAGEKFWYFLGISKGKLLFVVRKLPETQINLPGDRRSRLAGGSAKILDTIQP